MAGSFGFEAEKYDVSVKIGERVLLPAVRNAPADTLIVTDGFSCYQQIESLTGRKALHIAEVLQMAIREATIEGKHTKENSPQIYADARR
jgi:Fe-S oxidoreductase